jgi:aspartate carbamoyltransferase regulatory subunit
MGKTLSVSAIKDGTVIDHILQGSALVIIHLLKLADQQNRATVGLNLSSRSMGYKDLIKIENRFLTEKEAHDIAVFAPNATISIILNYEIEKKMQAKLPNIVKKILVCPNARCITRFEAIESVFYVREYNHKIHLHCNFCQKVFEQSEIKEYKT